MAAELTIGTRGSPLALAQARETQQRLGIAHPDLGMTRAIKVSVIRTTGDRIQSMPLGAVGGKGLFTKEIEEALLNGAVDVAVHSMKDVPTELPDGLIMAAFLPREDPRDALICDGAASLAELPEGARIGTSSLRRKALLLHSRPDLAVVPLRGNVETRLAKIASGEADATLLAAAGLNRLGMLDRAAGVLSPDEMLPAVCQGIIGLQCRADDALTRALIAPLNDPESAHRATAERALLAALDGSCTTPIAALATLDGDTLTLRAQIVRPDGSELLEATRTGPAADAAALGTDAGEELRGRAGPGFFTDD